MQFLTESDIRRLAERERTRHLLPTVALLLAPFAAFVTVFLLCTTLGGAGLESRRNLAASSRPATGPVDKPIVPQHFSHP
jgi:hypothetical protein